MVCTRSMQSTQKRNKLEQKTLESLLVTNDPASGEQVSISSRCAEMDAEIPLQLGVSRAVLENVLFCHQEESFWPLSEPSILKKKFDDILAATRYTKALDTLKALKKELANELRIEQQKLDHLKGDREKMARIQLEMEKNESRRNETHSKIAQLDAQLASTKELIDRLNNELKGLSDLCAELERVEHEMQLTEKTRFDLQQGLFLMAEDDQQLIALLEQHQKRNNNGEAELRALQVEKKSIEQILGEQSQRLADKSTEMGIFEAELKRINEKGSQKDKLVEQLIEGLGLSIESKEHFFAVAQTKINDLKTSYNVFISQKCHSEETISQKIQTTKLKISSDGELKKMKRKALEENQGKLGRVLDQLSEVSSAKDQIDEIHLRVLEEESLLNQCRSFFEAANYEMRLSTLNGKRKEIEDEIQTLNGQIAVSNKTADIRAKIELKRSEIERKTASSNNAYDDIKGDLETLAGNLVSLENTEKETERLWKSKDQELKALQERHQRVSQAASIAKSKYDHARELLSKKEHELADKVSRIERLCGQENFSSYFEECEKQLGQVCASLNESLASKATFESFIQAFGRDRSCPLCERSFGSKMDEELFAHKLSKFINSLPEKTVELQGQKKLLEDKIKGLKGLRSVSDDVDRLRLVELPELQTEIQYLEGDKDRTQSSLDDIHSELSSASLEEKKLAAIKKRAEEMGKMVREVKNMMSEVEGLELEMSAQGGSFSVQPLHQRLTHLQDDYQKILRDLEQVNAEMKGRQAELHARESRFRDLREQKMKIQLKQSEATVLEQSRVELESFIEVIRGELASIDKEVESYCSDLRLLEEERMRLVTQNREKEGSLKESLAQVEQLFREFTTLNNEIIQTGAKYNQLAFNCLVEERNALSAHLSSLQSELEQINERISVFGKANSEAIVEERNIRDNLKYREQSKRLVDLEQQAQGLRSKLGTFQRGRASTQLDRQELRQSELLGDRSGLYGELRQLQEQMERFQTELDTEYRTTETDYRNQFIRFNATSTAIEDLEKYAKALDQAIMKYHSYKMAEVNRIIREIWTGTYQGADIDTIEIRADQEGASAGPGGRSYNYRVVMVKGETELDMRGRSSAGQRVLTSLIIRLALAETFGQHCGVLALDEPTTNLDRDNIESLANSLAEIIKMRGQQGNFQLIIITHDEEFVDLLGRHECADYYWRVFKDERQYSTIERQSFSGI